MYSRSSLVNWIDIHSVDGSSMIQIGDSNQVTPETNVFAVQRERPIFEGNEFEDLSKFPIYSQQIPIPLITEAIEHITIHENPIIKVNSIQIIGVAASSVLHVGSTKTVRTEARIKNIRQFFTDPYDRNE
ncbi:spore germination protein GerPE [Pseudalkalibacillus hwajinpoensis]|uniref:spore germination protein GerPE n=1 Tax=Guptibacillus hwajinpoensis TaxID=208199 RepID=UPI00325A6827